MAQPALCLDLDGTLADSLPVMRAIYGAFLAHFGVQGCETEFQRLNGPPLREICAILQQTYGLPGSVEALQQRYSDLLKEAPQQILAADGAEQVLQRANQAGWQVWVVTSSSRSHALAWLQQVGLSGWIAGVVGGDDVQHGKPHAEPYLRALALSGAVPQHCLAVEDSVQGATAALAAGVKTLLLAKQIPASLEGMDGKLSLIPHFAALLDEGVLALPQG
ncbi:HAD-superfamily hydrolase, subfamily IA, variant 3 [Magnetococcus marinus MC-1]|uniref:HAD-superfamily hydrolase, subfamily IA, variant 3 n=1 Tax=Magnetococcus marinus (strain ATCC BAA-1437 / JCM 17883 / MC-1) TaxID=156889 RepID=A0LAB3_MAGMM|nr:HAD family phosphatase [Magnetococcus marinus]ABK44906.1 HAD-superfamily hydrolase, subfamily IA, variant 3 [Magnetococcus marinus MC-1]